MAAGSGRARSREGGEREKRKSNGEIPDLMNGDAETKCFVDIHALHQPLGFPSTGNLQNAVPRLRECCKQVETEEVSNSGNKGVRVVARPVRQQVTERGRHFSVSQFPVAVAGY